MQTMSVKFEDNMANELKKISKMFNISYSDFIRNAVCKAIDEKKKDFLYRLSSVDEISQDEESEILQELSNLSDDDMKIVKNIEIKL